MTTDERDRLLEQAYDAEQRGDLKEAERLRALANAPQERAQEPAAVHHIPFRYFHWMPPPRGR